MILEVTPLNYDINNCHGAPTRLARWDCVVAVRVEGSLFEEEGPSGSQVPGLLDGSSLGRYC